MDAHNADDKIEDKAWDVLKEMAHLRIIKDIRDELHMIKRVFSEQEDVLEALYAKADPKRSTNSKVPYAEERQLLDSVNLRLQRVDKLEREALMVEQRVSTAHSLRLDADEGSLKIC
jgi:Mg2+ and Co2+ transporter CorA